MQLSLLEIMAPTPVPYEPPARREVMTRAYGQAAMMEIGIDEADPIEIGVRGIPTLIRFGFGWQTYTVQPAGSAYWSETGFRSFGGPETNGDEIAALIGAYIDHKSGCNGKLTKWWPWYALHWRQNKRFADKMDRTTTWTQWGQEQHAEHWFRFDAKQAAALDRMSLEGIDPDEVWRSV